MREIDIETVKKAKKGDNKAFDKIITVYREVVISVCMKYMRNSEEACDMAQEAFCSAYSALKKFEFKSKFSTWIYRIAVNLCINRLDAMKRRKYFVTDSIHADSEREKAEVHIEDKKRRVDEEMECGEIREIIMQELESFSKDEKNVVILRDMQGLEYDEISRALKLPLGSVKSKLSRAREKLKTRLVKRMGS